MYTTEFNTFNEDSQLSLEVVKKDNLRPSYGCLRFTKTYTLGSQHSTDCICKTCSVVITVNLEIPADKILEVLKTCWQILILAIGSSLKIVNDMLIAGSSLPVMLSLYLLHFLISRSCSFVSHSDKP